MHLHQEFAKPGSAMRLQHEHIGDVGIGGKIADDPGKADLCAAPIINAKAQ